MNRYFKNILATFEEKAICVPIDLDPSQWSTVIPSGPGWYTIKSNVPKSVLERLGQPAREKSPIRSTFPKGSDRAGAAVKAENLME